MTGNKALWLAGLATLCLALFCFFRLYHLDKVPVFVDEAIYIRWSQVMKAEPTLRFLPLQDGKQPLFMWATIPFFKLVSDPLIAGRLLSVLAGAGSLLGIGFLAYTLFADVLVALLTSLIYAFIPFTVFFDRLALADSLLAMFGVWSLAFAIRYAQTLKLEYAMYLGFAIGGGLLTKSPALMFYPWSLLALFFFAKRQSFSPKNLPTVIWGLFLALVISQAMYAILRLGVGFQMIGARNQDYVYSFQEVLTHPLRPLLENLQKTADWLFRLFSPTVLLLGVLGFLNSKTRRSYFFLMAVSLLPLLLQGAIAKVYTSRYILFAVLPLIPLSALGLHWLLSRKGRLIQASVVLFVAVPLLLTSIYVLNPSLAPMSFDMRSGYFSEWTAGTGQKEVAEYLLEKEKDLPVGSQVVVFTEGTFGTLPDGLQIYTEGHPRITIVGSTPNIYEIPAGLLNTDKNNLRYYVLNSSRNHLPASEMAKLELIQEYPKFPRADGTHDSLLFFRLK